jgi:hypothetical protein
MDTSKVTTRIYHHEPGTNGAVLPVTSLGSGVELVYEKNNELSLAEAERLLSLATLPFERPLKNHHVAYLLDCMKRGTFRPEMCRLVTARVAEDGKVYRMNGSHTCWARTYMPSDYACKAKLAHYNCDTLYDARQLYAAIDRGAPRNKGHIINVYLQGTEGFETFSARLVTLLSGGLAMHLWPDSASKRQRHDGDDMAYLIQTEHRLLAVGVGAFVQKAVKAQDRWMMRAPVVGAMFSTFARNEKLSAEFWRAVVSGVGMSSVNDPRLRLRNALVGSRVHSQEAKVKSVPQVEMYAWCVNAWNLWRAGQPCKVLKGTTGDKVPKAK